MISYPFPPWLFGDKVEVQDVLDQLFILDNCILKVSFLFVSWSVYIYIYVR